MFCADCSSILFEVINTHSLISCTMLYSRVDGCQCFFCFFYSLFFCFPWWNNHWCVTVNKREWWRFLPLVFISGWTAPYVRLITTHLLLIPQRKYSSFYTTTCNQGEDLPYVKVRHDHLYTYSFTITVCLLWHAENDTVNMTYSSLRYVC